MNVGAVVVVTADICDLPFESNQLPYLYGKDDKQSVIDGPFFTKQYDDIGTATFGKCLYPGLC